MTEQEEEYIHFVRCIANLNEARRILQAIKSCKDSPLIGPAFQYALIEYSKPYKKSRGSLKKQHYLGDHYIPQKHLALHKDIILARDQIHAHSDLTLHEARVIVADIMTGKHITITQKLVSFTEKLTKIDNIIELIELSLDNMYEHVKLLEKALPINS